MAASLSPSDPWYPSDPLADRLMRCKCIPRVRLVHHTLSLKKDVTITLKHESGWRSSFTMEGVDEKFVCDHEEIDELWTWLLGKSWRMNFGEDVEIPA